ncbi:hypothetical protein PPGU19_088770 (plasmid) [Paraburkholderia sp. PGU19]|nr:hypothetical protein PPGU19_088770 [Paraburkholderia sp. PGU19]
MRYEQHSRVAAFITHLHALKRLVRPEEVARSVLYLASDESSFVTGTASLIGGDASGSPANNRVGEADGVRSAQQ